MMVPDKLDETVLALRKADGEYLALMEQACALSEDYFRILDTLDAADRERLQCYLDLCQDMEDRTIKLVATHFAVNGAADYKNEGI